MEIIGTYDYRVIETNPIVFNFEDFKNRVEAQAQNYEPNDEIDLEYCINNTINDFLEKIDKWIEDWHLENYDELLEYFSYLITPKETELEKDLDTCPYCGAKIIK